ncbi:unnamed protein product [Allacma fusca]|uniref:Cytochrome b-c1 complex subunit 7 n=1 Tax=Allacma fusca TaxID=39272 RepID=A0A8J2PI01_9HEXA|nr:unnamed protein product [Allacma fusca]
MSGAASTGVRAVLKRWMWTKSGFHKYGLKYHDILYETPAVKEAVRRLPQYVQDERNYRHIRALQASMQKVYLPEDQWTKYENDDYYLTPYLEEVEKEIAEQRDWATNLTLPFKSVSEGDRLSKNLCPNSRYQPISRLPKAPWIRMKMRIWDFKEIEERCRRSCLNE